MKLKHLQILILTAMLFCTSCNPSAINTTPTAPPTPMLPGHALLIIEKGEVQLKRSGWTKYYPASFGAVLYRGDLLQPSSNAEIFVVCEDLLVWNVPAGEPSGVGAGCPQGAEPVLEKGKSLYGNTRGADNMSIPYLISPRSTNLISATPTFRWNPVSDAAIYTVDLFRGENLEWSVQTEQTELAYPSDKPGLESNVDYSWKVVADNGSSSIDDTTPFLSFRLLNDDQVQEVENRSEKLASYNLPEEGRVYAQAWLYIHYGLYSDAIELLANQAKSDQQNVAVYRMLGELYDQIALPLQAKTYFEKAVKLAEITGDIENLAEIQYGLGKVYNKLGEEDFSAQVLSKAKDGFILLGEMEKAKEVEKLIQGR